MASACRPRKPELAMNASEMRSSRASRLRRAATLTAQPRAVAIAAAPSTSQKCAGWFSQVASICGRASSAAKRTSGAVTAATR